jgi:hypothetical protein
MAVGIVRYRRRATRDAKHLPSAPHELARQRGADARAGSRNDS